MAAKRILILGSEGAIGKILTVELRRYEASMVCVTRHGSSESISFEEALVSDLEGFDLVIDASTGSLNDYFAVVKWLKKFPDVPIVHITSVRAAVRLKRDEYGNYKRSALILLGSLGHRVKVLIGDLFSYQNSLVGYWSFVTNLAKWKFVSSRSLSVIDLQCLANTLIKFNSDATQNERILGSNVLEVPQTSLRVLKMPRFMIQILNYSRCNWILKYVDCSVVI